MGCGAKPRSYEALRKGEFQKQSSELFSEEGDSHGVGRCRNATEGTDPIRVPCK